MRENHQKTSPYADHMRLREDAFNGFFLEAVSSGYTWYVSNDTRPLRRSPSQDIRVVSVPVPFDKRGLTQANQNPETAATEFAFGAAYGLSSDRFPMIVAARYDDGLFDIGIVDVLKVDRTIRGNALRLIKHDEEYLKSVFKNYRRPLSVAAKP